jgi:broad specificity phosphatase PhoE
VRPAARQPLDEGRQRTRLILIRHAHHDPRGRFLQHACEGLTAAGLVQARALATRLTADAGLASPVVLASNSPRAIGTAEIVAEALGVPVAERTCDLCEVHPGAAEGLTPAEMERRFGPSYRFVPGAEWWPDWLPRARAGLGRIVASYPGRPILAVTHSGIVRASFVAFGGMPPDQAARIWSANTAITEWSSRGGDEAGDAAVWWLDRHNDTAHLPAETLGDIDHA